ncbi:hypothetical protein EMIHUDRAFT_240550 [Emiliania huxleyi CCMP1516]|uniref:PH domain-containing protein n=2 Tax=Emiliania huxleyi TaxID=2903 RepID=A0A0D3JEV8_EMIH1|nr:hypothetical protein EMIHUDRAFT_240550 [Emiliania huxleyi CCMP1516]EOD22043.1 hypothetical protein EMIHUDRAFT_240550 [Emiliania huxleyi CCMP1516]|eukprot:XP_005774472.1 hypothetical protein EMIHUDRAFT_240550 [Emiliania huxleyi CCMP1516]
MMPALGSPSDASQNASSVHSLTAMQPDLEPAHGRAARWQHALSSFGLLLTGRLELRNEILSALSVHTKTPFQPRESQREHEVWEERYFVLTRKALHYYIRARGDRSGKDGMFGKHEGTIGFNRIAAVVEDAANREVELEDKYSTVVRRSLDHFSSSGSLKNIPSLIDFRVPPPPHLDCAHDSLCVALEGGGLALAPLEAGEAGSATVAVQPPVLLHSHIRLSPSLPPAGAPVAPAGPAGGRTGAQLPPTAGEAKPLRRAPATPPPFLKRRARSQSSDDGTAAEEEDEGEVQELQVDALLADMCSEEHSVLHEACAAFRAAMQPGEAGLVADLCGQGT